MTKYFGVVYTTDTGHLMHNVKSEMDFPRFLCRVINNGGCLQGNVFEGEDMSEVDTQVHEFFNKLKGNGAPATDGSKV